jgi:hypothetical protein
MTMLTPARCAITAAAALAGLALTPATGGAALMPFGSDLAADANLAEARPVDTVYWQTAFPDGRSPASPASGQLRSVRIKGTALSNSGPPGGERDFHIQILRPLPDGTFQVRDRGTSGNFVLPPSTAPASGITEYLPENLCVQQGDVVAFNTVGGFGALFPMGTPLQIFSRIPTAVVSEFTSADQTNNGAILRGTPVAGRELLMQATVGTQGDGTGLCPGGGTTPPPAGTTPPPPPPPPPPPATSAKVQKATIPTQRVTVSKAGRLKVGLFCRSGPSRCSGTLRVMTRGTKAKSLGSTTFAIASGKTAHPTVRLNSRGRALLKAGSGRLAVKLVAETKPGGASRRSTLLTTLRRR